MLFRPKNPLITLAILAFAPAAFAANVYAPANGSNTAGVSDSTINEPLPTYVAPAPSGGGSGGGGGGGGMDNGDHGYESGEDSADGGAGESEGGGEGEGE